LTSKLVEHLNEALSTENASVDRITSRIDQNKYELSIPSVRKPDSTNGLAIAATFHNNVILDIYSEVITTKLVNNYYYI
jgi:hypothetical protein